MKDLRIKVCGMRESRNIAELALLQPDYIGFIFYARSSRFADPLEPSTLSLLPSSIKKTGVFVNADVNEVLENIEKYHLDAVQLHGQESAAYCAQLKHTGVEVIKAFGIDNSFYFNQLKDYKNAIDLFLFDTRTKQHGGSGKTFDWKILDSYTLEVPYFLSGGLSSENINDVRNLNDQRLYGLDLNSRFEIRPGLKDILKLTSVFNEIRTRV